MQQLQAFSLVAVLVAVVCGCSGTGKADITYPDSQRRFSSLNSQCRVRYSAGQNEIQKSLMFNKCNNERSEFSKRQRVSGWVGKIADISTDQGADVVSVTIEAGVDGFDMKFGTVSNRISDYATDTMITQSNPLFKVLANLKEGDQVSFDAVFLPHPDGPRGIWENSLTEQGSMDEPEFNVRFTDIRPHGGSDLMITGESAHDATAVGTEITNQSNEEASDQRLEEANHFDDRGLRPSFDCGRAATLTEETICGNSKLVRVDTYTADMYSCMLKLVPESGEELKKSQRAWIKRRESCEADVGCIRESYGDIAAEYMQYKQFGKCQDAAMAKYD